MTTEQQRRYRAKRIANGQCIACKEKAVRGKRRCRRHLADDTKRHAGRSTERYFKLKDAGLCVQCGKNPRGRFLKCQQCRLDLAATEYRKKSLARFEIPNSRSDAHLPSRADESYEVAL